MLPFIPPVPSVGEAADEQISFLSHVELQLVTESVSLAPAQAMSTPQYALLGPSRGVKVEHGTKEDMRANYLDCQLHDFEGSFPPHLQINLNDEHELDGLYKRKQNLEQELGMVRHMINLIERKRKRKMKLENGFLDPLDPVPKRRKVMRRQEPKEKILDPDYFPPFHNEDPDFIPPFNAVKQEYKTKIEAPTDRGFNSHMIVRCRLFCSHCKNFFYAKPTARKSFFVLNHQCSGDKRKQYVIGKHHRKCRHDHSPSPCIRFAPKQC